MFQISHKLKNTVVKKRYPEKEVRQSAECGRLRNSAAEVKPTLTVSLILNPLPNPNSVLHLYSAFHISLETVKCVNNSTYVFFLFSLI